MKFGLPVVDFLTLWNLHYMRKSSYFGEKETEGKQNITQSMSCILVDY